MRTPENKNNRKGVHEKEKYKGYEALFVISEVYHPRYS